MKKNKIDSLLTKLKKAVKKEIERKNWNNSLNLISTAGDILYNSNIRYKDEELEHYLNIISDKLELRSSMFCEKTQANDNVVVFYDGFGLNSRGLVQIYLKALCKIKKVVYITNLSAKDKIPDIMEILNNGCGKCIFITEKSYKKKIEELNSIIQVNKPGYFFLYSVPDEVVATTVMNAYKEIMERFQINLTDHAFWLGANAVDKCIEFRNYGASISNKCRNISKENLIKIPFYPIINKHKFCGFPFELKENQKVIFSGGSLYKTIGGGNRYYVMVDYILKKYDNAVFWYAGEGERTEIDKLIKQYPNRVFLTHERRDLYQVLENCYFYLSTYPICGGLMFQYVAKAGKIPLTLRYDNITDEFLINQDELNIQFDDIDDVFLMIDKLMQNEEYIKSQEERMKNAVISENTFEQEVFKLFSKKTSSYPIALEHIDTDSFRNEYLQNITSKKLNELIARKDNLFIIKYFPYKFCCGVIQKVIARVKY